MARLRADGLPVRYVIAGVGEDAEYLDDLIREHGLADAVHLIGAVSESDLPRWLNACDVFVMPNREVNGDNEGFGMVFIEAAACGKTSIAGEAGGTGSAVLHNQTGMRVDGESILAIESTLRTLLTDTVLRTRLAESAHARALELFGWNRVAESTERLVDKRN
jgi:phosphatidylinositol alpha-1,6-mannosyltransferase